MLWDECSKNHLEQQYPEINLHLSHSWMTNDVDLCFFSCCLHVNWLWRPASAWSMWISVPIIYSGLVLHLLFVNKHTDAIHCKVHMWWHMRKWALIYGITLFLWWLFEVLGNSDLIFKILKSWRSEKVKKVFCVWTLRIWTETVELEA